MPIGSYAAKLARNPVKRAFARIAGTLDLHSHFRLRPVLEHVGRLNAGGALRALELGCGTGINLFELAERYPNLTGVGYDLNRDSITIASQTARRLFPGRLTFATTDICKADIPGGFDLVLLADVLEHVPNPAEVMRKAAAAVREGGHILVSVPTPLFPRIFGAGFHEAVGHLLPGYDLETLSALAPKELVIERHSYSTGPLAYLPCGLFYRFCRSGSLPAKLLGASLHLFRRLDHFNGPRRSCSLFASWRKLHPGPRPAASSAAAVVVTYNRKELLARCLDALLAQTHALDAIYVVDNASTDGTREVIAERYQGRVHYTRLPKNVGGAGGFHEGMRIASMSSAEWLWVMDDDVRAESDALEQLLRAAPSQNAALVPVRLTDSDGSLAEAACTRYDLGRWLCLPGQHMTSVMSQYPAVEDLPETVELANFSFEGALIPAAAVRRVGLPLAPFFIYGDDTEFALRLREIGMRVLLVRAARMRRMLAAAGPVKSASWKTRYIVRNQLWINRLHGRSRAARSLRNLVWAGALIASNTLRLRFLRDREHFNASIRGVWEGLTGTLPTEAE